MLEINFHTHPITLNDSQAILSCFTKKRVLRLYESSYNLVKIYYNFFYIQIQLLNFLNYKKTIINTYFIFVKKYTNNHSVLINEFYQFDISKFKKKYLHLINESKSIISKLYLMNKIKC